MSRAVLLLWIVTLVAATACGRELTGPLASGEWGGVGISFAVSSSTVQIEFDCAHGSIDGQLLVQAGRFSVEGVYVREHGGPQREDEEPDMTPATYDGVISGETLRLTVRPHDRSEPVGPYLLQRDGPPQLRKCL